MHRKRFWRTTLSRARAELGRYGRPDSLPWTAVVPLKIEVFRFRRRMSRREDKFRNFDENLTQRKATFEDRIVFYKLPP